MLSAFQSLYEKAREQLRQSHCSLQSSEAERYHFGLQYPALSHHVGVGFGAVRGNTKANVQRILQIEQSRWR